MVRYHPITTEISISFVAKLEALDKSQELSLEAIRSEAHGLRRQGGSAGFCVKVGSRQLDKKANPKP